MNDMFSRSGETFADLAFTAPGGSTSLTFAGKPIGSILFDADKLGLDDAERVLRRQKETGLRFGETAVELGLLTPDDIRQALSSQYDYAYLAPGDARLDASLIAAFQPSSPAVEDLRALRSQLRLRWFDDHPERRTLAVVGAGTGEGRSHIAANLAILFSQLGARTLVVDADLRRPRQHELFRLPKLNGLSELLSGRCGLEAAARVDALRGLSVLPAGSMPPNPQELLARPEFPTLLHALGRAYDLIVIDTPASAGSADAHTVATRARAALLVTRQHDSSLKAARELVHSLQQYGTNVVGSVLNQV